MKIYPVEERPYVPAPGDVFLSHHTDLTGSPCGEWLAVSLDRLLVTQRLDPQVNIDVVFYAVDVETGKVHYWTTTDCAQYTFTKTGRLGR